MGTVLAFKAPETERLMSQRHRGTALVIDDNAEHLATMESVARDMGFEPVSKHGIRQAAQYIRCGGTRPNLVITDNNMEVSLRDGIEVIRLTKEFFGPDVEVILYSSEEPSDLTELREKYPQMYFAKKGSKENLQAAIRRTHTWKS